MELVVFIWFLDHAFKLHLSFLSAAVCPERVRLFRRVAPKAQRKLSSLPYLSWFAVLFLLVATLQR